MSCRLSLFRKAQADCHRSKKSFHESQWSSTLLPWVQPPSLRQASPEHSTPEPSITRLAPLRHKQQLSKQNYAYSFQTPFGVARRSSMRLEGLNVPGIRIG